MTSSNTSYDTKSFQKIIFDRYYVIRGKIFNDISEYINEVNIKVKVPKFVLPSYNIESEYEDIVPSWIKNQNPNELVVTYLPTVKLIELLDHRIEFYIVHDDDVLRSYLYVTDYINSITQHINIDELDDEMKSYIEKTIRYQQCLKRILEKFALHDPGLKSILYPSNSIRSLLERFK